MSTMIWHPAAWDKKENYDLNRYPWFSQETGSESNLESGLESNSERSG